MQDLVFLILLFFKKDAVEWGGGEERSKKNPDSIYKNVHNRLTMAVKIRGKKSNLSGTSFFNNVETLNARKIPIHVILASKFPSIYFIGTNALNKLFVLFTEESWSTSSLLS